MSKIQQSASREVRRRKIERLLLCHGGAIILDGGPPRHVMPGQPIPETAAIVIRSTAFIRPTLFRNELAKNA